LKTLIKQQGMQNFSQLVLGMWSWGNNGFLASLA